MAFRDSLTSGAQGETPEERRELDYLFSLTYEELRRLALGF